MIRLDTNVPTLNTSDIRDVGQLCVTATPSPQPPV